MNITLSQYSSARPERLFDLATNFHQLPAHIPEITAIEVLTEGPIGVGTKFKETRVMFGKEATETFEVTVWEPGRRFTMQAASCGVLYSADHIFHAESGGTRIEFHMTAQAQTLTAKLMSPLSWLMKGMMKKAIAKDLAALAKAAETPPGEKLAQAA